MGLRYTVLTKRSKENGFMETTDTAHHLHLTMANEDYLECIVRLEEEAPATEGIRSVDIAQALEVSKASVNKAVTVLKEQGLVEQSHYGKVMLTDLGREIGRAVWARHQALRNFHVLELGVDFERADSEACQMEHALSEDTMNRLVAFLDRHVSPSSC